MISELPRGWTRAPIGSLCSLVNGRAFKPTEWTTSGVPIVRIQNLNNPSASYNHYQGELDARHRLNGGELLFAWSGTPGTSFGAHIWHGQQAALNQHIFRVDFDERLLDKRFFRFAINEKLNELIGVAQGGVGLRHVTKGVFESTEVTVPPRKEQTRIADHLDTLLARIKACNDHLDAIPGLLKRFRRAVLDQAMTGAMTDLWRSSEQQRLNADDVVAIRLRHEAGTAKGKVEEFLRTHPPQPAGPLMPQGWLRTHVGTVGAVSNGSTPSRGASDYWGGEIPWVSSGEVANGTISSTRETITASGFDNSSVRLLPPGTVLIAMIGEGKTRGQSALLTISACINQNVAGVVPVPELIASRYLWYWFQRQYETTRTTGNGSGPKALNCERVRELEVLLPPLVEQAEIVQRVEALFKLADRIEARYVATVSKAQRLTPLTLAKAFRGELVQQDPNDEPASVLLQRLAKTSAVAVKAPRSRPRNKPANPSTPPPATPPDWTALPAGAWAADGDINEHTTTPLIVAVLRAWGQPMPQDQARLAVMLCLQPRLFTAALPARDASLWRRLVGAEAEPLPASVAALQPAINAPWGRALGGLRARGDLVASGPGPTDTWTLGPGADRVETVGWPDGRAAWVVAYLRAHGVEAVLPSLPTAAVDFVHARAA